MEQITRKDGVYYYGDEKCDDIEDAYLRFRGEYHKSIGRKAFSRLDRLGQRRERIHGFGYCFSEDDMPGKQPYFPSGRQRVFLLGLLGIHYFWIIHLEDLGMTEEQQMEYLDWLLMKGNKALLFSGRKKNTGRTSKRLNARIK